MTKIFGAATTDRAMVAALVVHAAFTMPACSSPVESTPSTEPEPVPPALSAPVQTPEDTVAKAWFGDDPGAFADAWIATMASFERPVPGGLVSLGTTADAELARSRRRFVEAKTTDDVYYALVSLRNAGHDVHRQFGPRGAPRELVPKRAPVVLRLDARVEYAANGAPSYVVSGRGIPPNSVLEAVDGVPIAKVEDVVREWYPLRSIEGLREQVAGWLSYRDPIAGPAPLEGDVTKLSMRDPRGARVDVDMTWSSLEGTSGSQPQEGCCASFGTAEAFRDYGGRQPSSRGVNWCTYTSGQPGLVVARACSFDYPDAQSLRRDQGALLEALRGMQATRVLFDVRENGGGSFDPAFFGAFASASYKIPVKRLYFAPGFRANPELLSRAGLFMDPIPNPAARLKEEMIARPDALYSSDYAFFCKTAACDASEAVYPAPAVAPTWKAAVLTGPYCVSACDDFVSIMKDNGIATSIGMPSAAADAPFQYAMPIVFANRKSLDVTLTVGVSLRPGTTTILEGNPPSIDVPLLPSASNRGQYLDAAIAAAKL